jgi:hypothetical protein
MHSLAPRELLLFQLQHEAGKLNQKPETQLLIIPCIPDAPPTGKTNQRSTNKERCDVRETPPHPFLDPSPPQWDGEIESYNLN